MAPSVMPPLIVIVGETASGKSSLALEVAERLDGEIVCADSWTVYAGFDIGTAKPSAEDRERVPHHLLDVADPAQGFSAVVFQRLANQAIADIHKRGKLPLLVGGTGLYVDSVIYDYSFLPAPEPGIRQRLESLSLESLLAQADKLGLDTSTVDIRNKRRIVRLIENNGQIPTKHDLRQNTIVCGLRIPRDQLQQRIEQRVDDMIATGLEDEVAKLAKRYGWSVEPMKGIGYREWQAYFTGQQTLEETRQRIIKATVDLAKRQRTWFKRNNSIHWLDNSDKVTATVDLATTFLNK